MTTTPPPDRSAPPWMAGTDRPVTWVPTVEPNLIFRRADGSLAYGRYCGGGAAYSIVVPVDSPDERLTVSYVDVWATTDMAEVRARIAADRERRTQYELRAALARIEGAVR